VRLHLSILSFLGQNLDAHRLHELPHFSVYQLPLVSFLAHTKVSSPKLFFAKGRNTASLTYKCITCSINYAQTNALSLSLSLSLSPPLSFSLSISLFLSLYFPHVLSSNIVSLSLPFLLLMKKCLSFFLSDSFANSLVEAKRSHSEKRPKKIIHNFVRGYEIANFC
jgi:hypothetical protein